MGREWWIMPRYQSHTSIRALSKGDEFSALVRILEFWFSEHSVRTLGLQLAASFWRVLDGQGPPRRVKFETWRESHRTPNVNGVFLVGLIPPESSKESLMRKCVWENFKNFTFGKSCMATLLPVGRKSALSALWPYLATLAPSPRRGRLLNQSLISSDVLL